MIKLSEGELLDLLPAQMKYDEEMICLSYALKCGMAKATEYEKRTMTANFIDQLPEKILDVLAAEMRSPYYSDSMGIGVKRQIIKNTYVWHLKAGTVSAVSEMVAAVFGEGSVVEWPDFEDGAGGPYMFDIATNARLTEDIYKVLVDIIDRVTNVRSHLRRITIDRGMGMKEYAASGVTASPKVGVMNNRAARNRSGAGTEYHAAGVKSSPEVAVTNIMEAKERGSVGTEYLATGIRISPTTAVTNIMGAKERDGTGRHHAATKAIASPAIRLRNTLQGRAAAFSCSGYAAAGAASAPRETVGNNMAERSAGAGMTARYAAAAMSSPKITI